MAKYDAQWVLDNLQNSKPEDMLKLIAGIVSAAINEDAGPLLDAYWVSQQRIAANKK